MQRKTWVILPGLPSRNMAKERELGCQFWQQSRLRSWLTATTGSSPEDIGHGTLSQAQAVLPQIPKLANKLSGHSSS